MHAFTNYQSSSEISYLFAKYANINENAVRDKREMKISNERKFKSLGTKIPNGPGHNPANHPAQSRTNSDSY